MNRLSGGYNISIYYEYDPDTCKVTLSEPLHWLSDVADVHGDYDPTTFYGKLDIPADILSHLNTFKPWPNETNFQDFPITILHKGDDVVFETDGKEIKPVTHNNRGPSLSENEYNIQ